ncbi:unnamed protein product [Caenorhabditis auriculariae]|uniref:Uncharacterized protein n=1 Tax=Caenorhabditis auriculariae TaxID=2777116 RepID=A0A8S1H1W4_9PELO|nr:unnamed protein product [Caenorhabditis auriculariae]
METTIKQSNKVEKSVDTPKKPEKRPDPVKRKSPKVEMTVTGEDEEKWVALITPRGRVGNQLFYLINGFSIGKTLGRKHFVHSENMARALRVSKQVTDIFPKMEETFTIMDGEGEKKRKFALDSRGISSCCTYEDPMPLKNHTATKLYLLSRWTQSYKYFLPYLEEIKKILEFSPKVVKEGNGVIKDWGIKAKGNNLCVHTRRGDFTEGKYKKGAIATNATFATRALKFLNNKFKPDNIIMFGDSFKFMKSIYKNKVSHHGLEKNFFISTSSEGGDLYLSSKSSWFSKNQSNVFYNNYYRPDRPRATYKDFFPTSWQPLKTFENDTVTIVDRLKDEI